MELVLLLDSITAACPSLRHLDLRHQLNPKTSMTSVCSSVTTLRLPFHDPRQFWDIVAQFPQLTDLSVSNFWAGNDDKLAAALVSLAEDASEHSSTCMCKSSNLVALRYRASRS